MNELINEQTQVVSESQSDDNEVVQEQASEIEQVSLGRFKDVSALLTAYNSLQAEFTKRCQRIKELESKISSDDKAKTPTEILKAETPAKKEEDTTLDNKETVIKEYLKDLFGRRRVAVVMDGSDVGVKTPVRRPKTVRAAGELAKELLGKNI